MGLVKMAFALIAIHLGLGFTQLVVSYFGGDVAHYGARGFVAHTPIGAHIDLSDAEREDVELNLSNIRKTWDYMTALGGVINGLASFNYGFLSNIQPEDGLPYQAVMLFRLAGVCFLLALGILLLRFLFDSGILNSKLGMSIVALGLGLGALSSFGALFG